MHLFLLSMTESATQLEVNKIRWCVLLVKIMDFIKWRVKS